VSAAFVTGTDTGCGKTTVAVAIACAARAAGLRVRVLKPIETGCEDGPHGRLASDALALARAAGDPRPAAEICPYVLALPAAPAVAARAEHVAIDPERLRAAFRRASEQADLVLVEGAGGLRVPILEGLDMAGLAGELGLALVVVARSSLGTLNHTRLTLDAAAQCGLRTAALFVNDAEAQVSAADRANLQWLLERPGAELRVQLPHASGADAQARGEQLAAHVPLPELLAALG